MSGDLAAFLAAWLDEDEAAANEVHLPRECGSIDRDGEFSAEPVYCSCDGPGRVRAEVAAKRAILAMHSAEPGQHPDFCGHDMHELPCPTLRILAAVYSGHPAYDPAWALSGSPVPDRHHEDEQQQQAHGSGHGERPI